MMRRCHAALLAPLLLCGCSAFGGGMFDPAGPIARAEFRMFRIDFYVMLFVLVPIWIVVPLFAWHYRLSNRRSAYRPKWDFSWWVEASIWIPPSLIVAGLGWMVWTGTQRLDPYRPLALPGPPLRIQAVSFDWKWLFIYPDQHIATLNALIIPAGRPISISLTSGTVMQSLLIPRLAGQIYAMAGMTTQLHIAADRPGLFRGENTQYNGAGFHAEKFPVAALPEAGFAQWVAGMDRTGQPFDQGAYAGLFEKSSPNQPILYAHVPEDLFTTILDRDLPGAHASGVEGQPR